MISSKQFNSSQDSLGRHRTYLLQLDIAGRVDDVALDLVATIVRDGVERISGSEPLGFVTVKASPGRTTRG
jgi:hypothetical protein